MSDRGSLQLGVRGKLFAASAGLILIGVMVTRIYFTHALQHGLDARATDRFLVGVALAGVCAAAVMSWLAAALLTEPIHSLTSTARMMIRDLSVRTRLHVGEDADELAAALDELADARTNSIENLGQERDRLQAILEAMAEGVLVTDGTGAIVLANRAMREMFYVGRDVLGSSPIEAFRNAELYDAIDESMRSRAAVTREIPVDGVRPRKLLVRLALIDDQGTEGTVAVLTDVTELRRLETVRRDFVANVSHELRTPIAAIRAAVETLEGGAIGKPDAPEFLSIVSRHAQRLQQIVEDLLELSKIEAKELKLALEPVDVRTVSERSVDLLRLAADRKRITLTCDVEKGLPAAKADARALEQVLSNLVDNAIKYSPDGRTVRLRAGRGPRGIRISVQDNGPGIEAKHLPRIFERFYRVDPGRSRQVGGTGLGLAIVKHLSEAIDGAVSVESAVGRGTTFHVDLPAADASTQERPTGASVDRP